MASQLVTFLITILVFIISSLPLYFAVKFLGGKTSILKTALITFLTGLIVSVIQYQFKTFGGLIAFVLVIWIYHEMFRLKWLKAFFAWVLQFVFIIILYIITLLIISLIIGVSVISLLY